MRIFYLADANSIHIQRLTRYFILNGYEVHLVSSREPGIKITVSKLHLLRKFPFKLKYISAFINFIYYAIQIRRLIKEHKPDLLHAFFVTDWGILAMMSRFHPFIVTSLGSDILLNTRTFPFIIPLVKYTLREADLITSDGYNTNEEIIKLTSMPQKCKFVLAGVDLTKFTPERTDEELRKKLKINQSPLIISTRSLSRVYDVETLIKAIPLIQQSIPDAKFIIIGDGAQKQYLIKIAESLNIMNSLHFIGHIPHEELGKYLAISDIYVSTSLSDTIAISTLEAMACCLPVVVTDVGDIRRWVVDDENGYIIPVKRPDLLAQKVIYVIQNMELKKKMGETNRRLIEQTADLKQGMNKLEILYKNLVKEKKK
jgi:L-malate glycosyltransferase